MVKPFGSFIEAGILAVIMYYHALKKVFGGLHVYTTYWTVDYNRYSNKESMVLLYIIDPSWLHIQHNPCRW